jgi:hypothetical protein
MMVMNYHRCLKMEYQGLFYYQMMMYKVLLNYCVVFYVLCFMFL